MIYHLTIKYADGRIEHKTTFGALAELMDEAYDDDARGITAIVQP